MNRYAWLVAAALAGAAGGPSGFAQAPGRYNVAIVQPANEETVHDNEGKVVVQVAISPDLAPGDRIVLLLDGRPVGAQGGTTFALSGIERGAHTLQAQVVDASSAPLTASAPVTFHLWQASRLFPGRKGR